MYMALVMRVGSIIKCQAVAHAIPVGLKSHVYGSGYESW